MIPLQSSAELAKVVRGIAGPGDLEPLFDELIGLLNVYHDTPHEWTVDELDTMDVPQIQPLVFDDLKRWKEAIAARPASASLTVKLRKRLRRST